MLNQAMHFVIKLVLKGSVLIGDYKSGSVTSCKDYTKKDYALNVNLSN